MLLVFHIITPRSALGIKELIFQVLRTIHDMLNWSINSLIPRALHGVMMWNTDTKNYETSTGIPVAPISNWEFMFFLQYLAIMLIGKAIYTKKLKVAQTTESPQLLNNYNNRSKQ